MDMFECLVCGPAASRDPHSPFCPGCGEPLFVAPPGLGRVPVIHDERRLSAREVRRFPAARPRSIPG